MGTFIFNLNDATALNDSVVARLEKLADVCKPTVIRAETNSEDVEIARIVCETMDLVVIVLSVVFVICYLYRQSVYKKLRTDEMADVNELKKTENAQKKKEIDQRLEIEKNNHVESLKRASEERALKILNELTSIAGKETMESIEEYKKVFDNILNEIKDSKQDAAASEC